MLSPWRMALSVGQPEVGMYVGKRPRQMTKGDRIDNLETFHKASQPKFGLGKGGLGMEGSSSQLSA